APWRRSPGRRYWPRQGLTRGHAREDQMTVSARTPTIEQVLDIADSFGLHLSVDDAKSFQGLMAGTLTSYARVDEMVEPKPAVKYPRDPGYRPGAAENRYNAWYWKCEIKGAAKGPLAGK